VPPVMTETKKQWKLVRLMNVISLMVVSFSDDHLRVRFSVGLCAFGASRSLHVSLSSTPRSLKTISIRSTGSCIDTSSSPTLNMRAVLAIALIAVLSACAVAKIGGTLQGCAGGNRRQRDRIAPQTFTGRSVALFTIQTCL
jgi:hypothetical protein